MRVTPGVPVVLYNELDKHAVRWIRELVAAGAVAPGRVDDRSIQLLTPADLEDVSQFHAFAGVAVWS